eukprot:TRINITY_DN19124_c0_g1_i2.p1 TRINITY_DN19124_c0_g1~~TRINITY_DN19124_c0_g1_i2.p1  ORF type:complete len:105 (+),score=19.96 TRINITY_DN19124_c0_g1_i2:67-381(+)
MKDGAKMRTWTCRLCEYSKNTEDLPSCKTCGRPRGHEPEQYWQRRKEISSWADEAYEDGGIGEYWGLIVGFIFLVIIVGALTWAYLEDQKALYQQGEEIHAEEL